MGFYYAVAVGLQPGIYETWAECEKAVKGFPGAKFKKFRTSFGAEAFLKEHQTPSKNITAATSSSSSSKKRYFDTSLVSNLRASSSSVKKPKHPPEVKYLTDVALARELSFEHEEKPNETSSVFYYAVAKGRNPGVYTNWEQAEKQIDGIAGVVYKKCQSKQQADEFMRANSDTNKSVYYAVAKGRMPGVYKTWEEAELQVLGQSETLVKKFGTMDDAEEFVRNPTTYKPWTKSYYAVAKGRKTGVYDTWAEAEKQIRGLFSAKFKKFDSVAEAEEFIQNYEAQVSRRPDDPNYMDPSSLVAFCDGSAISNGNRNCKAGWGCVFPHNPTWNVGESLRTGRKTNNRAEYLAALAAMKRANLEDAGQTKPLFIFSDSVLLIRSMTEWITTWKKNNWMKADGNPVMNKDILIKLFAEKGNRRIIWEHVKAHTNRKDWKSVNNDLADKLAKQMALQSKPSRKTNTWRVPGDEFFLI